MGNVSDQSIRSQGPPIARFVYIVPPIIFDAQADFPLPDQPRCGKPYQGDAALANLPGLRELDTHR